MDRLLTSEPFAPLLAELPRDLVVGALQREIAQVRARLSAGGQVERESDPAALAHRVEASVRRMQRGSLVPVINATGVILHTNLGRAPLAAAAVEAMQRVAAGYCNLEYDIESGSRGSRYIHARQLLVQLSGGEDALVVNNNAAALVLALNTLARGRDAVISRGELVEIGGAFRVPEIMARSGARLHEVGSTNRTHLADYRDAVDDRTGVLLKVHPSNFTMDGYTAEVGVRELATLAERRGVPLVHDIGSGLLIDPALMGMPDEPWAPGSLKAGAHLVTMSGDKLLGGPQCGIVVGRGELIERMRRNPLCRAFRVDKLTLAALEATLRLYLDPLHARRQIPTLRMLTLTASEIGERAGRVCEALRSGGADARMVGGESAVGGGAAPAVSLETVLILVTVSDADRALYRLRSSDPAVVARVVDDCLALDLRTVPPGVDKDLTTAVLAALGV